MPIGLDSAICSCLSVSETFSQNRLITLGAPTATPQIEAFSSRYRKWMTWTNDSLPVVTEELPSIDRTLQLIVAVDVKADHCAEVLKSAAAAALAYKIPVNTTLLGLYQPMRATTFGIYEYLALVAKLVEIGLCPDAIVMSVD